MDPALSTAAAAVADGDFTGLPYPLGPPDTAPLLWVQNTASVFFFLIFCWPCISIYLFININQLDALNFAFNKFIASLYMFRAHVLIVRRAKIVLYSLWSHHTYRVWWYQRLYNIQLLLDFDVLLTVHLSIFILVINQLDALNLFYSKFISSLYMFRGHVLIIRRSKLYYTASGIITLIGGPPVSQPVHGTATYRCDDTRSCIIQFSPPDDEHMCSKHEEAWNKLIIKFTCNSVAFNTKNTESTHRCTHNSTKRTSHACNKLHISALK